MRPLSTTFSNRHRHTWYNSTTEQGLVAAPREIKVTAFSPPLVPLTGNPNATFFLGQLRLAQTEGAR